MFPRKLFYLTYDHLTAYQWEKSSISGRRQFPNDETGWADFSRFLGESKDTPIYLLVDLVEEDFQLVSLPHVVGGSRKPLIQRRLGQLYRDTPYRQATYQGRDEFGRKDDKMLFSALTNAGILKPWLSAIMQQKAPLTGIYSAALLSASLIKKLALTGHSLLLATHQSNGLRQSLFQGGNLKFSRLTPLADHSPDAVADTIMRETVNTQQFLASSRMLVRGETLEVVILAQEEVLQPLQSTCRDTPAMSHRFIQLADAATQLGLKDPASVDLCDPLFLHLLGQISPASYYAQAEQIRYFRLWQTRLALYILSIGVVAGTLIFTGENGLKTLQDYQQIQQLNTETGTVQSRYQSIVSNLPETAASPQTMKAAVNTEQMISRNAPAPAPMFEIISRALEALPQIRINELNWQAVVEAAPGAQPDPALAQRLGDSDKNLAPAPILLGLPKKPGQTLQIEGEVVSLGQDYRTALESVRLFAAELGKNKQLQVEITHQPLDVKPSVKLTGSAGVEGPVRKVLFTIKLTLRSES